MLHQLVVLDEFLVLHLEHLGVVLVSRHFVALPTLLVQLPLLGLGRFVLAETCEVLVDLRHLQELALEVTFSLHHDLSLHQALVLKVLKQKGNSSFVYQFLELSLRVLQFLELVHFSLKLF